MPRALPPLNALRAFEAAGRHLSFSRAADELNVTPAAVSHHIKGLEERLGVQLFRREARRLLLTDAGQRALPGVRDGFERLAAALAELEPAADSRILTVSAVPSLSAKWLVPRLERFRQRAPELDVRLDVTGHVVDFQHDPDIDVAIRYGRGHYPGLEIEKLVDGDTIPVCSPGLIAQGPPLTQPDDLRHYTLIHTRWGSGETDPAWSEWLAGAGAGDIDASRGPRFNHAEYAVQAAIDGQGVVLAARVLVEDDLAAGRLVTPFDWTGQTPESCAYYIVAPPARMRLPRVRAFRAWLLDEMAGARDDRAESPAPSHGPTGEAAT
jgi:LysR family glycine cleavage system transcriptional activator